MNVLLWFAAVATLALAWLVFAAAGPNPVSQVLWVVAVVAGLLGHLADRAARS